MLGDEHEDSVDAASNLADLLRERGKLTEAEVMQQQVLAVYKRLYGQEAV